MNNGRTATFDFSKLKARWARESEERQVLSARLSEEVRIGANSVLRDYGATRAFLFGSITAGQVVPGSDVDLLVLGVERVSYWDLRRDLEQALGRPLDFFIEGDALTLIAKIMTRGVPIYGP